MSATIAETGLSPEVAAFITGNLPVFEVPTVPEIRLHKASPQSGLWRLAQADAAFDAPYWAHYWGGGLALGRYILDHRETVSGRRVLDLGCGSGLVGIAAALAGAREVTCIDIDPYAVVAAELNAAMNNVSLSTKCSDILDGPPPAADIILVGDLFYDQTLADRVTVFLDRRLTANIEVLVGDPRRATLPLARLRLLAEYPGLDFGDVAGATQKQNAVFRFVVSE
jgi:predicted nicotinamide N-methyase